MNEILRLTNIKKKYKNLQVLKDINLYIKRGEFVCLLGPSGSGKTTLFKIVSGLINASEGEVIVASDVRKGYVFQEPRLLPWKTVEENISFVQKNYLQNAEAKNIREKLLYYTGLQGIIHNYPGQLSGGMKQRIEFMRALSIKPDLLMLDEPFKSIDAQTLFNLRQMLLRIFEESDMSIFMITHNPEEAVLLADRIYILSSKPARIIRELKFKRPQYERSLHDKNIYESIEEIIDLFNDIVGEFRWGKNEKSIDILKNLNL